MPYSIRVDGKERATADSKALAISIGKLLSRKRGHTVQVVDAANHTVYYCEG